MDNKIRKPISVVTVSVPTVFEKHTTKASIPDVTWSFDSRDVNGGGVYVVVSSGDNTNANTVKITFKITVNGNDITLYEQSQTVGRAGDSKVWYFKFDTKYTNATAIKIVATKPDTMWSQYLGWVY